VVTLGESEENAGKDGEEQTSSRLWTPYGDPRKPEPEGGKAPSAQADPQEELSEEEMSKRIEEAMEKITVADVVVDMIVSLSSLAYQRMGIPHEVNEKYRDMEQARLAIECIEALLTSIQDRVPPELLSPITGTLDNLKLNFAKES
jgi:hypothetical protein